MIHGVKSKNVISKSTIGTLLHPLTRYEEQRSSQNLGEHRYSQESKEGKSVEVFPSLSGKYMFKIESIKRTIIWKELSLIFTEITPTQRNRDYLFQQPNYPIGKSGLQSQPPAGLFFFIRKITDGCPARCQESVDVRFLRIPGKFWTVGFVQEWDYLIQMQIDSFHAISKRHLSLTV